MHMQRQSRKVDGQTGLDRDALLGEAGGCKQQTHQQHQECLSEDLGVTTAGTSGRSQQTSRLHQFLRHRFFLSFNLFGRCSGSAELVSRLAFGSAERCAECAAEG